MSLLARLLRPRGPAPLAALYAAAVGEARDPAWYRDGHVPDTFDGRFDMLAAVIALMLVRLEADGAAGRTASVALTERFVDDMDGHVRERGIGDLLVGKHVGRMVAALGGRLDAYRAALAGGGLEAALARNLWRGSPPGDAQVAWVADRLRAFARRLDDTAHDDLVAGRLR